MNSLKIAAQFAAHTWYMECKAGQPQTVEATKFARENWREFLGAAHVGVGRLLLRIARLDQPKARRPRQLVGIRQSA